MFKTFKIVKSYTIEASFLGYFKERPNRETKDFSIHKYLKMGGKYLANALLEDLMIKEEDRRIN